MGQVPLEAAKHGGQIFPQHGPQAQRMRQPSNCRGETLKHVRVDGYSESGDLFVARRNAPGNKRRPSAASADLEIVAASVDPSQKSALEHQPAEIVNFVPRFRPRPDRDRVLPAEGMTQLEVAGRRYGVPEFVGGGIDLSCDGDRPFEAWIRVFPILDDVFPRGQASYPTSPERFPVRPPQATV